MSVDRPNETEAELVDRRGREADERYRLHLVAIEDHRRNGTARVSEFRGPAAFNLFSGCD